MSEVLPFTAVKRFYPLLLSEVSISTAVRSLVGFNPVLRIVRLDSKAKGVEMDSRERTLTVEI